MDALIHLVIWLLKAMFGETEEPAEIKPRPRERASSSRPSGSRTSRGPYSYGDESRGGSSQTLEDILDSMRQQQQPPPVAFPPRQSEPVQPRGPYAYGDEGSAEAPKPQRKKRPVRVEERQLDARAVKNMLGIDDEELQALVANGDLPASRSGGALKFKREDVVACSTKSRKSQRTTQRELRSDLEQRTSVASPAGETVERETQRIADREQKLVSENITQTDAHLERQAPAAAASVNTVETVATQQAFIAIEGKPSELTVRPQSPAAALLRSLRGASKEKRASAMRQAMLLGLALGSPRSRNPYLAGRELFR